MVFTEPSPLRSPLTIVRPEVALPCGSRSTNSTRRPAAASATAVNLAVALAAAGRRVLLVDLDPQGNATSGLTIVRGERNGDGSVKTIYDSLVVGEPLPEVIHEVRPGL